MRQTEYKMMLTHTAAVTLGGVCAGARDSMRDQLNREAERRATAQARWFGLGSLFYTPTRGLDYHPRLINELSRLVATLLGIANNTSDGEMTSLSFNDATANLLQMVLIPARECCKQHCPDEVPMIEDMLAQLPFKDQRQNNGIISWKSLS